MHKVYSTIAGASHACRRVKNLKKATLLTAEQQKEKAAARAEKQARIDVYVQKWIEDMANLVAKMATEFDMKPQYFLDIFF
jgi:Rps23 Pro-64 3,4-dihydroxylase Tpa1-like proline 4-hydroxylase